MVNQLVQAGVTAELIFAALEKKKTVSDTKRNVFQTDYLKVALPQKYLADVTNMPRFFELALLPFKRAHDLFSTQINRLP